MRGWQSQLPYQGKVFIWRMLVGGLPTRDQLSRRKITLASCFFCTTCTETVMHLFMSCPVARQIWSFLSCVWEAVERSTISAHQWIFGICPQIITSDSHLVIFHFLRWTGLWHIWTTRNGFIFDSLSGIHGHILRIRGLVLWQFSSLLSAQLLDADVISLWSTAVRLTHL